MDRVCCCGDSEDDHYDPASSGSTACLCDGCKCIAFDWDGEDQPEDENDDLGACTDELLDEDD